MASNILQTPLDKIKMSNSDVFFVQHNLFNDYYIALRNASSFFVEELINRTSEKRGQFMMLLGLSVISLVVALSVLFPVLIHVNAERDDVLSLFLDIPERTVKVLN